jgi:hypothetical protein
MTTAEQFRQYAEEALRAATETKSDKDKEALIKLARVWWQAASKVEIVWPVMARHAPAIDRLAIDAKTTKAGFVPL